MCRHGRLQEKNIDSDVLQLRIGELSQFEHDSVVEMLTEAGRTERAMDWFRIIRD